jgi:predicted phosphoribosyltransferase
MTATSELLRPFRDRTDAGRMLAAALHGYRRRPDTVVLALLRGGIVPAAEIANALALPLDVVISRKLGAPGNAEYAIGALAEGGTPYLNQRALRLTGASAGWVAREVEHQRAEIARRQRRFRGGRQVSLPERATVILVDDGVATGSTAIAAIHALRQRGVARLVFAVPVAPPDTAAVLRPLVDELVLLATPRCFHAVGNFYEDFTQVSDDDVVAALARARTEPVAERGTQPKEERDALA